MADYRYADNLAADTKPGVEYTTREPEQIPADLFNVTLTIVAALHGLQGNRDSDIPVSVDTISSAMRIAKQLKAAGHVK